MQETEEENKLIAMEKAGASRGAAFATVVKGLTAKKMTIDKYGDEHYEDDTANNLRSAEIICRLNGDMKSDVTIDNRRVSINMVGVNKEMVEGLLALAQDVKGQLEGLKGSGKQTGEIIDIG